MPRWVRFYQTGSEEVLKIEAQPSVEPADNEVLLRVEAIGLNRAENLYRAGHYIYPPKLPSTLGYEAAGIVEAVGRNVREPKVGDRVSTIPAFSMAEYGVYAEKAIVPAYAAVPYPARLSPEEAASIWMQYITAYGGLVVDGKLKRGDYVLITAATGGLGVAAIQITRQAGAISIATTRKQSKRKFLESLAPDHIIVTSEDDLVTRVAEITRGHGADVVFDAVLGTGFGLLAESAARHGRIITYGALAPDAATGTPYPTLPAISKGLTIKGYTLFELTYDPARYSAEQPFDPAVFERARQFVYQGLETGNFHPKIDRVFPFDQIVQAHCYVESDQQQGKVVVQV